jgi:hypothetical protein
MVARSLKSERGISLIVVIMMMVIILAITGAGLLFSNIDLRISGNYRAVSQAFNAADTGANVALSQLGVLTANSILPFNGTINGTTYCSGTIAATTSCATPQSLVALPPVPASEGCSLANGSQVGGGGCHLQLYQIDVSGIGPLGSERQVQVLATYGSLPN